VLRSVITPSCQRNPLVVAGEILKDANYLVLVVDTEGEAHRLSVENPATQVKWKIP
jgi:hypothetical protein